MPVTPVTPVSTEGLTALHSLIKEDAHTLNTRTIQRLQKHIQKLANTAYISFAERALLYDYNQFLTRMNDEAKKRRLSKSMILGRAKVISYEDIEETRARRAAKENTKSKRKGSQTYQFVAAEENNFESDMAAEVVQRIKVPQLGRAPVARVY